MLYLDYLDTIESILTVGSFFVLFLIFLNEKYPFKIFSNPFISIILMFLVALHGHNIIVFLLEDSVDYLKLFLFIVSILTFSLKAFIFRL